MWFVRSTMWVLDTDSVLYQWQDGNQVRMMKPYTLKEKKMIFFLDGFFLCGVVGRVLEPIPVV